MKSEQKEKNGKVITTFASDADFKSGDMFIVQWYDRYGGVCMAKFNEKLRILLENQGWTQAKLAKIMHVSPDAVSSWVRGNNTPYVDTFKELCKIFCVTIQELTDDDFDIPEYIEIDRYLPNSIAFLPEEQQDSEHIIIDAALAYEGLLHRYTTAKGVEISSIYRAGEEVWWHYREHEARMIRDWNEVHSND